MSYLTLPVTPVADNFTSKLRSQVMPGVKALGVEIGHALGDGVTGFGDKVAAKVKGTGVKVGAGLKSETTTAAGDAGAAAGKAMGDKIAGGTKGAGTRASGGLAGEVAPAGDTAAKGFLGRFVSGVAELPGRVKSVTTSASAGVASWWADVGQTTGGRFVSGVASGLSGLAGRLHSAVSGAGAGTSQSSGSAGQSAGAKFASGLVSAASSGLGKLRGAVSAAVTHAQSALNSLKVPAAFLAGGVAAGVGFGLKTAAAVEQASISFRVMLGDANKANVFLGKLRDFAASTPFEFPELQTAASSLLSAGVNADKIIPIMRTLGNATSAMGTGSEGVKRATVALQQMSNAGKITGEDLNQLRDAGVPVFDLLAAATGKSKEEVAALAQSGKLGKKEMEALFQALETGKGLERFNGLMDEQSKSLTGLISTLKDTVTMGLADLVGPAIPALKAGLGTVADLFSGLGDIMSMVFNHDYGGGIKALFSGVDEDHPLVDMLLGLNEAFKSVGSSVASAIGPVGNWRQLLLSGLMAVLPVIISGVRSLGPVLAQAVVFGKSLATGLASAFMSVAGVVGPAIMAIARGLTSAFAGVKVGDIGSKIADTFRFVADSVRPLIPVLGQIASFVGGVVKGAFMVLVPVIAGLLTAIRVIAPVLGLVLGALRPLVPVIGVVVGAVLAWNAAQWLLNFAMLANPVGLIVLAVVALVGMLVLAYNKVGWFRSAVDGVVGFFKGLPGFFSGVWSAITGALSGLWSGIVAIWSGLVGFFSGVWSAVSGVVVPIVSALVNGVVGYFKLWWTGISTVLYLLAGIVVTIWEAIRDRVMAVVTPLVAFLSAAWQGIKAAALAAWELVFEYIVAPIMRAYLRAKTQIDIMIFYLNAAWAQIKGAAAAGWQAVHDAVIAPVLRFVERVKSAAQAILGALTSAWNSAKSATAAAFNAVYEAVRGPIDRAMGVVAGIKDRVFGAISGIGSWLYNAGAALIGGLWRGVSGAIGGLYENIKRALSGLIEKGKQALGVNSPSKLTRDHWGIPMGEGTGLGAVKGLRSAEADIRAQLVRSVKAVGAGAPPLVAADGEMSGSADRSSGGINMVVNAAPDQDPRTIAELTKTKLEWALAAEPVG